MSLQTLTRIGIVSPEQTFLPEQGVEFEIPGVGWNKNEKLYIGFSNEDLDRLAIDGVSKALGTKNTDLGFITETQGNGILPFFVWGREFKASLMDGLIAPSLSMNIDLASMSHVNEHRGTLSLQKKVINDNSWEIISYAKHPNLVGQRKRKEQEPFAKKQIYIADTVETK